MAVSVVNDSKVISSIGSGTVWKWSKTHSDSKPSSSASRASSSVRAQAAAGSQPLYSYFQPCGISTPTFMTASNTTANTTPSTRRIDDGTRSNPSAGGLGRPGPGRVTGQVLKFGVERVEPVAPDPVPRTSRTGTDLSGSPHAEGAAPAARPRCGRLARCRARRSRSSRRRPARPAPRTDEGAQRRLRPRPVQRHDLVGRRDRRAGRAIQGGRLVAPDPRHLRPALAPPSRPHGALGGGQVQVLRRGHDRLRGRRRGQPRDPLGRRRHALGQCKPATPLAGPIALPGLAVALGLEDVQAPPR